MFVCLHFDVYTYTIQGISVKGCFFSLVVIAYIGTKTRLNKKHLTKTPYISTGQQSIYIPTPRSFKVSVPEEERLDTGAIYVQLSIDDLHSQVPQINWHEYFDVVLKDVAYTGEERLVSYSMPYFVELGKVLARTDQR